MSEPKFEGWMILELMGHRRLGGLVSEQIVAGKGFIRIDIHGTGDKVVTQLYNPDAVYGMTPTSEAIARGIGQNAPAPVSVYELPQLRGGDHDD